MVNQLGADTMSIVHDSIMVGSHSIVHMSNIDIIAARII